MKKQNKQEEEFKTKFNADIEQDEKQAEKVLNNYTGEKDYKVNPTF